MAYARYVHACPGNNDDEEAEGGPVTKAKGFELHMSDKNTTGYLFVRATDSGRCQNHP